MVLERVANEVRLVSESLVARTLEAFPERVVFSEID